MSASCCSSQSVSCSYFRGRVITFLGVVALSTLNHEITLLLIPISAVVLLRQRKMLASGVVLVVVAEIGLHLAIRWVLFQYLPVSRVWSPGGLWFNLDLIALRSPALLSSILTLLPWWGLGTLGLRFAPTGLRWTFLLAPLLVCTTLLMGKLNEPRQFDALMPVLVACILCLISPRQVRGVE